MLLNQNKCIIPFQFLSVTFPPGLPNGIYKLIYPNQAFSSPNLLLSHCALSLYVTLKFSHSICGRYPSYLLKTCFSNIIEVPQKIKIRTTIWSSNTSSGCLPLNMKTFICKDKNENILGDCCFLGNSSWCRLEKWLIILWRVPKIAYSLLLCF